MATNIDSLSIEIGAVSNGAARGVDNLINTLTRLNSALNGVGQNRGLANLRNALGNEARDAGMEHVSSGLERVQRAADGVSNSGRRLTAVLSRMRSGLGTVASGAGKLFVSFAGIPKQLGGQFVGSVGKATSAIGNLLKSFKRIAMYRILRTVIKEITEGFSEGVKNLYHWSSLVNGTFAPAMDRIATATQYLRNSLGAMVSPLLEALAPAIDFIIDKFVALLNVVNQVFARLTGRSTYTAAKKVAAQWDDSANKVKSAADKMKRTILAFDEINRLDKDTGGSGSSGKKATDYGSMFETRTINDGIKSFVDELTSYFKAQNWQGLGQTLGAWVNKAVDSIDWSGIGTNVGTNVNALFSTAYWTLDTINFTHIGESVADFLNNDFANVDFSKIGGLMVQKFSIIGDLIIGFFSNFNFATFSKSAGDFVKGVFDEITKFFNKYEWKDLGTTIYGKLKDALTNFDFSGVATSMFTALGTALRGLIDFGFGFVGSLWSDIRTFWKENIAADDWKTVAQNVLIALGMGFKSIAQWVFNNIINPFITAFTGDEQWAEKVIDFGKNVISNVKAGIDAALKTINDWVITNVFRPVITAFQNNEFLMSLFAFGAWIISGIFTGIKNVFVNVLTWIKTYIFDPILSGIKSVFGIASPAKAMEPSGEYIAQGILKGIASVFTNIVTWLKENIFDPIVAGIKEFGNIVVGVVVTIVTKAKELWQGFKDAWFDLGDKILGIGLAITTKAKALWDEFKGAWFALGEKVLGFGLSIVTKAQELWNEFMKAWFDIGDKILGIGITIITRAKALWDGFKDAWFSLGDKVLGFALSIVSKAQELWNGFKAVWAGVAKDALEMTAKIVTTARALWSTLLLGWKKITNKVLSVGILVSETAKSIWEAISSGWKALGNTVLSVGISLLNTAKSLWLSLSFAWGFEDTVLNVGIWVEKTARDIWNTIALGWYAISNTVLSVGIKLAKTAQELWNELQYTWNRLVSDLVLNVRVALGLETKTTKTTTNVVNSVNNGVAQTKTNTTVVKKTDYNVYFDDPFYQTGQIGRACGGVLPDGSSIWRKLPSYASGTANAHGSLFLAGEYGPEVVGHIGGRTEVLNKSQLAATMFDSVRAAMSPAVSAIIALGNRFADAANEALNAAAYGASTLYAGANGGYMAASDGPESGAELLHNMQQVADSLLIQNDLLRQQNDYLRSINDKDYNFELTAADINRAQQRQNRRSGMTIVPVATT